MSKNTIEFETTRKDLTHLSGLVFFEKLIKSISLDSFIGKLLPDGKWVKKQTPKQKFFTILYSFIAGAESIDDINQLGLDSIFNEISEDASSAVTFGRFLKLITYKNYQKLQHYLPKLAFALREKLYPKSDTLILNMDATDHIQHGKYMEGVSWNYKDNWCLSSQNCFDEYGLCYGWHLREGSAHSSVGAVEMLNQITSNLPVNHGKRVFFRADSAYGNKEIYNTLLMKKINFTICLSETSWGALLRKYETKIKWKKTKLYFFESNKCQIGSCLYPLKDLYNRGFLRVVFVRAKNEKLKPGETNYYRHYAIITDMSERQMSDEAVVKFYTKRGNVENQIKDLKYGMDFKHFPCQKLSANRAWGIIGIYAYNLMRYCAHVLYRDRGCFLKTVRRKMVYIASEVRRGQRKIKLRFTHHIYKEVKRLELMITAPIGFYRSSVRGRPPTG